MPVIDVPEPDFMAEPELQMFTDAAGKFFQREATPEKIVKTLDDTTSAIAKMCVTDMEWQIVDDCLKLQGGYGYINEYPIAHMFRNSRIQRIYGGSNEIMKVLIARSL